MTVEDQRRLGVKLATEIGAGRTLDIIKDTRTGYRDIFRSAAAELGSDKLCSLVLEQDEPSWATAILRHVPDIDKYRDALTAKLAPLVASAKPSENVAPGASLGNAAAFDLAVVAGASYSAYFTLYWQIGPNVIEPAAGYSPNTPPYKWSNEVLVGQSTTNICKYFGLPKAPLAQGNTVWMVVDVCGGGWYDTGFKFAYDPLGDTVAISADGGTLSASFSWKWKR